MDPNKPLHLLRDGFKQDFAMYVFESEEFAEILMDLSSKFVDENIPIVDEETQMEMAFLMMESIKLGNY